MVAHQSVQRIDVVGVAHLVTEVLSAEAFFSNRFLKRWMSHMKTTHIATAIWELDTSHSSVCREGVRCRKTSLWHWCKGFSKTMLNRKVGNHTEGFEQHFMVWFPKMFSGKPWVIYVSFCSSHHICEFINGKSSFFAVFESQDNDCLERPIIFIGTAVKFITFDLLDIFCNKKWKLFSPGPYVYCSSLNLCGRCVFLRDDFPGHFNGTPEISEK